MNRVVLVSRSIRSIGYEPMTRLLEIEFQDGSVYRYSGVPPSVQRGLVESDSPLVFFQKRVRDRFQSAKVQRLSS